jgi:nucleotide-binding universal stress UspA family protein
MRIILAVDLSAGSNVAVTQFLQRPWPAGSVVEVLSVTDTEHLPFDVAFIKEIHTRTHAAVDSTVMRLREAGMDARPVVLDGDPKTAIAEYAKTWKADLVVVGAHQGSGFTDFLMGSVAKAVLRTAPCSVEVARGGQRADPQAPVRVLLATDGLECSTHAAHRIAARSWPKGTEVRVISVVELMPPFLQAALEPQFLAEESMEQLRAESIQRTQEAIAVARQLLADAGLQTSEVLSVELEDPKTLILKEAKEWPADLIFVGSHGKRGFNRIMLGSESEAVAMHAECSVEVVRIEPA